ncbi:hypothetical protein W02_12300 [Nitrospira sp. KM1]|uniref:hypothetical protein n=1 Tax=Nitrospira sp. KM1 TaxID=1936990 RepID=UPI0013A79A77|nr:hypothetical protein [Nitrospira sp. KM1]BCA54090.1 hypothetical protein W02_12300 [Nitrospira sp. KM1]
MTSFEQVVAALAESIIHDRCDSSAEGMQSSRDTVTSFVLDQCRRMPDYLRFPFRCLTLVFGIWPVISRGRPFHLLTQEQRIHQVHTWKASAWGVRRDLVKFYEAFVIFAWYSERYADDGRLQTSGHELSS